MKVQERDLSLQASLLSCTFGVDYGGAGFEGGNSQVENGGENLLLLLLVVVLHHLVGGLNIVAFFG